MKLSFYQSRTGEDIALCMCVSYLSACTGRDDYIPEVFRESVRGGAVILLLLCWLCISFANGLRMRKGYAVGMCLCLTVPCAVGAVISAVSELRFSSAGILLDDICEVMGRLPYAELERISGINGNIFSVMTAGLSLLLFGAGYLYTKSLINNDCERNDIS